jgi:hypothetical protein
MWRQPPPASESSGTIIELGLLATRYRVPATAFLHFLCIPCAQSVTALSKIYSSTLSLEFNSSPECALEPHFFDNVLDPYRSPKSPPRIFLNCTKNTELTARPFARTFTLALSQKVKRNLAETRNG